MPHNNLSEKPKCARPCANHLISAQTSANALLYYVRKRGVNNWCLLKHTPAAHSVALHAYTPSLNPPNEGGNQRTMELPIKSKITCTLVCVSEPTVSTSVQGVCVGVRCESVSLFRDD
jgi:hypothetical protein